MTDIIERAEAALEGVTENRWAVDPYAYLSPDDDLDDDTYWDVNGLNGGWVAHCQDLPTAKFIAQARALVSELITELKYARKEIDRLSEFEWMYQELQ